MLLALCLGLMLWAFAIWAQEVAKVPVSDGLVALDALLGLASVLLLPLRRRWPLPINLILGGFTAASAWASPAAGIALVSLATRRRVLPLIPVGVMWIVSGLVFEHLRPSGPTSAGYLTLSSVIGVLVLGTACMAGFNIGAQRQLAISLRERAETLEREQHSRVSQAKATERARIAREMHDVLAHRISLIAMHAGALSYRKDLSAQETARTAELIRDTSQQALAELRDILGVLRSLERTDAVEAPQPTLTGLGDLLARERQAGADVAADIAMGNPQTMPAALFRNAFRIVQEALTNARKHAPGMPVHVRLTGEPGAALAVEVRNRLPERTANEADGFSPAGPSSGMGLAGLTERAMLSGGELRYGPDLAGDFVVRARLPWAVDPHPPVAARGPVDPAVRAGGRDVA